MTESAADITTQTEKRLIELLALVEKDNASLHSAKPEIAGSGGEVYDRFIDLIRQGLDNLAE